MTNVNLRAPGDQAPSRYAANTSHIIDGLRANFIASLPAEEVYHAAQERGFTWARGACSRGAA